MGPVTRAGRTAHDNRRAGHSSAHGVGSVEAQRAQGPLVVAPVAADLDTEAEEDLAAEQLLQVAHLVGKQRHQDQQNETEQRGHEQEHQHHRDRAADGPAEETQALEAVDLVAPTPATVLISGETGVGKEVVARAVHGMSRRKGEFVAVNCGAVPEDLVESALFGHEKGAFTGAYNVHHGFFERAEHGTLFLDEIDSLPLSAQSKLLRVLQDGEYDRVGGRQTLHANVRVVAASNRLIADAVAAGEFRSDLYYRLNVVPIFIPPLRERREDVHALAQHFLRRISNQYGGRRKVLGERAWAQAMSYAWPGNVRELENFVNRLCAIHIGDEITAQTVEQEFANQNAPVATSETSTASSLPEFVENHLSKYFAGFQPGLPPEGLYHRIIQQVEVPLINATLAVTGGNQIKAANLLGINRNTLRSRIKELGLSVVRTPGSRG